MSTEGERGYGLFAAAREGKLLEYLRKNIPRDQWTAEVAQSWTATHFACLFESNRDALAVLLGAGADANAAARFDKPGQPTRTVTCLEMAVKESNCGGVELLLAAGAALYPEALADSYSRSQKCTRILIANGARMNLDDIFNIPLPLIAFQRGILRCRAAVVAMLRVRRAGQLWRWDKYLLAYISHAIWATRYEECWAP